MQLEFRLKRGTVFNMPANNTPRNPRRERDILENESDIDVDSDDDSSGSDHSDDLSSSGFSLPEDLDDIDEYTVQSLFDEQDRDERMQVLRKENAELRREDEDFKRRLFPRVLKGAHR